MIKLLMFLWHFFLFFIFLAISVTKIAENHTPAGKAVLFSNIFLQDGLYKIQRKP